MKQYLPWLILALPALTLLLCWNWLPEQLPLHASGQGVDRYGSRSDFTGLVMIVTAIFGLVGYFAIRVVSSFSSYSQTELSKAYLSAAAGATLVGFGLIGVRLMNGKA